MTSIEDRDPKPLTRGRTVTLLLLILAVLLLTAQVGTWPLRPERSVAPRASKLPALDPSS